MSDLSVGKNGMRTYVSPVKITRPGDPGFPDTVTHYLGNEPPEAPPMPAITTGQKTCCICMKLYKPTSNVQRRCPQCLGKSNPKVHAKAPTVNPCQDPGCDQPKLSGPGKRYCAVHGKPKLEQAVGRKRANEQMPEAWVAESLANLRKKLPATAPSAFDNQVGGDHYKDMAIQPVEFISKNGLGFCEGNVVKYICRHHLKGGSEDLDKAIHYLQLLRETLYGQAA